jgi:tetratricopeptide (TPR) repeat protein
MNRRNRTKLEEAIEKAKTSHAKALAYYRLGLFHDNNSREAEAIPNYEKALKLGLDNKLKAEALAWLASSFYKTGQLKKALASLKLSRRLTKNKKLQDFLNSLRQRIIQDK